jgi:hypothetical protein
MSRRICESSHQYMYLRVISHDIAPAYDTFLVVLSCGNMTSLAARVQPRHKAEFHLRFGQRLMADDADPPQHEEHRHTPH